MMYTDSNCTDFILLLNECDLTAYFMSDSVEMRALFSGLFIYLFFIQQKRHSKNGNKISHNKPDNQVDRPV